MPYSSYSIVEHTPINHICKKDLQSNDSFREKIGFQSSMIHNYGTHPLITDY
jgi:hypothetical protein